MKAFLHLPTLTVATNGYLVDADTLAWPKTKRLVKQNYPEVKIIIPGHGKTNDRELLNYTINLFSPSLKK